MFTILETELCRQLETKVVYNLTLLYFASGPQR